jgi:hypothetical protein
MKKLLSTKRLLVRELRSCIRDSRKCARQINKKLELLAELNKRKASAQQRLVEWCGLK